MSQSVSVIQFDEEKVNKFWDECVSSHFSINTTQQVNELSDIIRDVQSGEYNDNWETAISEIDNLIVSNFAKREFSEYYTEIHDAVSYFINLKLNLNFDKDFSGDFEKIDMGKWREIFSKPKKLKEVQDLDGSFDHASMGLLSDLPIDDLFDYFMRMREVFDYSYLTDTEMVVIHEDVLLSQRWGTRLKEISTRAIPILKDLSVPNSN